MDKSLLLTPFEKSEVRRDISSSDERSFSDFSSSDYSSEELDSIFDNFMKTF